MGIVRYLAPDTDAYVASVRRHAAEFEAQTGHRLEVRILESDEYFSNRIGPLLTNSGGPGESGLPLSGQRSRQPGTASSRAVSRPSSA